ncbi:MAG: MerR family transcriptional regulator [Lachnospiraceae bacterium]|nr:MerR family transcriptional regulator [Lachnospiraceae bacterium]
MAKIADRNQKNLRVCRKCRRFFEYQNIGYGLCPDCTRIDNENFEKVKDYLIDHGAATAQEISNALDISEIVIYQYLRDGRIEIPDNSPIYIKCELCHADIRYGKYCPECAMKMKKELNKGTTTIDIYEVGEKPKNRLSGKMHIYEN